MRIRAPLILAITLLGVIALSGAALAATKTCSNNPCVGTNGPDRLIGNTQKNEIRGLRAADYIAGKPSADDLYGNRAKDEVRAGNGRDRVFGGRGEDQLYGGGGNDTMNSRDAYKDNVTCGLGTDTAYVDKRDQVNEDCENVFVSGGNTPPPAPVVDKVYGKGELGSAYGNPRLRVNAELAGTNPDDAQGTFSITYPGDPDVARDNTYVRGAILCLAVSGKEARLVGQIGSASGPRAENGTFEKGEYVRIGVLDAGENDKINFSPGEQTFTSCNGETPNLDVLEGNFVVQEDV
jgi:RTX calcium-binding nonapeptide repeat (4 copies)